MSGFSLINSNLLLFWPPGFCCKNSYISWLFPHLFGAVSQSYRRDCHLGLSPQQIRQMKPNSQLLGCAFFFQSTLQMRNGGHRKAFVPGGTPQGPAWFQVSKENSTPRLLLDLHFVLVWKALQMFLFKFSTNTFSSLSSFKTCISP